MITKSTSFIIFAVYLFYNLATSILGIQTLIHNSRLSEIGCTLNCELMHDLFEKSCLEIGFDINAFWRQFPVKWMEVALPIENFQAKKQVDWNRNCTKCYQVSKKIHLWMEKTFESPFNIKHLFKILHFH